MTQRSFRCNDMRGLIAVVALALPLQIAIASAEDRASPAVVGLVIDTSGSLKPSDLAQTRSLAGDLLAALPRGSEVTVFAFDDQSRNVLARTTAIDEVRKAVDGLAIAGHYTALNDALYDASRSLREAPQPRKAILLVTDGRDENSALNLDDALKLAQDAHIQVLAVGAGHVEERVLRRIAKLTAGEYYRPGSARGDRLAARILEIPATTTTASSAVPATPPGARGTTTVATSAPATGVAARSRWPWALLVGGVGTAAVLLVLAARRRSDAGERSRCSTCNRPLSGPLAECSFCDAETAVPALVERKLKVVNGAPLSDTVLQRMDLTEEFLEKTVTLREDPVLTITNGAGSGHIFNVSRETATSIGRAKANDVVLEDVSVSSQHCRVRPEDGGFVVHDLKSTNGTFVNERRITRHTLAEGDVIKCGETYLQFRLNQRRV